MARMTKKKLLGGSVDISGQLWHYDRAGGYREVSEARPFMTRRKAVGRDGPAPRNYTERLMRLMSAGGMRHEKTDVDGDGIRLDGRVVVGRWLVALSALWIVFRFVEL